MDTAFDVNVIERIQKIYATCTPEEKHLLRQILEEYSQFGYSDTYNDIWLADYKEIPVDIDTFIESDLYLGKTNRNGQAVYPFWRSTLREIFAAGNKYEEVFFTGATRIGKSSTAITGTAYMLYKLMCLRDPQRYYGKKDISKFSILFFNITKELASSVAYREFQDTILASPWFLQHGRKQGSEANPYYVPEGGKVVIDFGSSSSHALGQQVFVGFCVVGSTEINTPSGTKTIEQMYKDQQTVVLSKYANHVELKPAESDGVVITDYVNHTIEIELNDGTVIEGTPEHRIMLQNKTYKSLLDMLPGDRLFSVGMITAGGDSLQIVCKHYKYYSDPIPVYDIVNVHETHNFIIAGNTAGIVSHNCDECNFSKAGVKDVSKAKAHMADLYNTVSARVKGTFRMDGEVHGKIFAVSSKRSDSDFMENYMQSQIEAGAGEHMYISDAPQWEVLPPSMFHKEKFTIAVGNRNMKGFVVPPNEDNPEALLELEKQGYQLLHPPIDMRPEFTADFDIALRDLAGISVPGALSFITQEVLNSCIGTRKNPFLNDILQIGTKDNYTIEEWYHTELVDPTLLHMPMFIHLDLSKNTDMTGISGVCISGRKDISDIDGKVISQPTFSHVFSVSLQAPRGDKIPYAKITSFICWLRKQGYNIQKISRDQFQSEYMAQLLEAQGFDVNYISLDRTPDGYMALRSVLLEQRMDMLDVKFLQDELIHLQRDSVTGKVDHLVGGSKDVSDSFAGALWNAILSNPAVPVPVKSVASAIASVNGPRSLGTPTMGMPGLYSGFTKYSNQNTSFRWR